MPGFLFEGGDNGFGQLDQFAHLLCWEGHAGSPKVWTAMRAKGAKGVNWAGTTGTDMTIQLCQLGRDWKRGLWEVTNYLPSSTI